MKTFVEKYDTVTAPDVTGDDEDYEREAPPPSDIDGCDWDGLSASFTDTRRERNPGIYLRRVKRPHRHVLSSVWDHLFPLTELLSLN